MEPNADHAEASNVEPQWATLRELPIAAAVYEIEESPIASKIVFVNEAHEKLSGYRAYDLVGHSSVLLAGARPDWQHVARVLEAPRDRAWSAVTRKVRPDGTAYDVEVRWIPLFEATGRATHMLVVQREKAREGADGATIAREMLRVETRATRTLAAGLAYEIDAPLSRLLVELRALAESAGYEDGERVEALVDDAERIESCVRGLRAFTSIDDDASGFDVNDAVERALALVGPTLATRAKVTRIYGSARRVRGRLATLAQALAALFRNAAAAIPPNSAQTNAVTVRTASASGEVTIEIADTGVGIEPEDLPFVFDPFFTTKPNVDSPGLGLASARAAIVEMGGAITIASTLGRGTVLTVRLPVAPVNEERAWHASLPRESAPTRTVLCVSDSACGAQRLGDLVEDDTARLVFATADEAIARVTMGETIDAIFCDARADRGGALRERLASVAPDLLSRTFTLSPRASSSGTFARVAREEAARIDKCGTRGE